jgi:two-component system, NtrC family, sensor kinase
MLAWLFEKGFMPHGHCYYWRPDILWLHVISDGIIALAYFSIPITLLYFLRRRPDIPFPAMIALFAIFIVLCGTGHVIEIWTVWNPVYAMQGAEKAATALASIFTAVAMVPIIPQVLAMRTPAELQQAVNRAVNQLHETQDRLVRNEKMASLGALVAGVSHEINTPVGIGVTAASALQEQSARIAREFAAGDLKKSELEHFLQVSAETSVIILRNLQRAADLLEALDQVGGERRQFALRAYLDEVLLSLRPKLRRVPHQVSVDCPHGLVLDTYPGALAQVLTNLITNTLVHAFPDGRAGRIDIAVRHDSGAVRLDYSDDGIGMPPENLRRVFDPFFTTKRGTGGTGLGMHIVYNLVTQMLGGTIEVSSTVGQGTRVVVLFPAEVQKAAA